MTAASWWRAPTPAASWQLRRDAVAKLRRVDVAALARSVGLGRDAVGALGGVLRAGGVLPTRVAEAVCRASGCGFVHLFAAFGASARMSKLDTLSR